MRVCVGAEDVAEFRQATLARVHVRGKAVIEECVIEAAVVAGASAVARFVKCDFTGSLVASVACLSAASVKFEECHFGSAVGAVCMHVATDDCANVTFDNCAFDEALLCGVLAEKSTLRLSHCSLRGASLLAHSGSELTMTDCAVDGGGIVLSTDSWGSVRGCSFVRCRTALTHCPQSLSAKPVHISSCDFAENCTDVSTCWGPEPVMEKSDAMLNNAQSPDK